MINKVFDSFDEAIADIQDGAVIAVECWGYPATAHNLIAALRRKGTKDLTLTCGCGPLLESSTR